MLKSKDILLRPLQESDLKFLDSIENNTHNWKFGSEKRKFNKQELLNYISNANADIKLAKQFRFVIVYKNSPIGFIDLFDYTLVSAAVGVFIDEEYRKNGFAKQSLELLCHYAFEFLNLEKIYCSINKENIISIKLFSSIGFELDKEIDYVQYFIKLADNN